MRTLSISPREINWYTVLSATDNIAAAFLGVTRIGLSSISLKSWLVADRQTRDLPQNQITYAVTVCIFTELTFDEFGDGGAGREQLEFGAAQSARERGCRLAEDKNTGSGLADATEIDLAKQRLLLLCYSCVCYYCRHGSAFPSRPAAIPRGGPLPLA